MTVKIFLSLHKRIRADKKDVLAIREKGIELDKLHLAIGRSRWLKNAVRLSWLIDNYTEILAGKYEDYPEAPKVKHFAFERTYSAEEFEKVYGDIASIEF